MAVFVNCRTPIGAALASYFCSGFYCFHHSGFGATRTELSLSGIPPYECTTEESLFGTCRRQPARGWWDADRDAERREQYAQERGRHRVPATVSSA